MTVVLSLAVVILGVLAILALVLRGALPSERAELVRAVAKLLRRPRGPGAGPHR
ncbi:MAG: hypothetical protein ACRDUV_17550 [Pseudonocardiaceae bacterium]